MIPVVVRIRFVLDLKRLLTEGADYRSRCGYDGGYDHNPSEDTLQEPQGALQTTLINERSMGLVA